MSKFYYIVESTSNRIAQLEDNDTGNVRVSSFNPTLAIHRHEPRSKSVTKWVPGIYNKWPQCLGIKLEDLRECSIG